MQIVASSRPPFEVLLPVWDRERKTWIWRELFRPNLTPAIASCPACGLGPDAH